MRGITALGVAVGAVGAAISTSDNMNLRSDIGLAPLQFEQRQGEFQWRGRLASGKTIEIKGVNGDVTAEPSDDDHVEVIAAKRSSRSDPDDVSIEVLEHEGGVTICALYPSARRGRSNECGAGDDGHMNGENNDVRVRFTVRVSRGVRFAGRTVNGAVLAESLDSDVLARTVNGDIELSTRGLAEASTVNGSIEASLGRSDWPAGLEFSTVNGRIALRLPADVGAEVRAKTVNGDMEFDFPVTVTGRFGPRQVSGTIGSGGPVLDLSTVNGGISLLRGS